MIQVFRVYAMKEDGFVVVIAANGTHSRVYGLTEFQVAEVLRAAGTPPVLGESLSLSSYKKQYGA